MKPAFGELRAGRCRAEEELRAAEKELNDYIENFEKHSVGVVVERLERCILRPGSVAEHIYNKVTGRDPHRATRPPLPPEPLWQNILRQSVSIARPLLVSAALAFARRRLARLIFGRKSKHR